MKFISPMTVTTAMLVSSTRAENDYSAWSSGTTYAIGNRVISTGTHRIYESVQNSNTNHDPTTDTTATWWLDVGPTNRWAMFDRAIGSVTSQATPLTVVLDPGEAIQGVALLDVDANQAVVSMTDGAGGATVYSRTTDMSDQAPLVDWYMYFFEPLAPRTTLILDDLPPYRNGRLTVSLTATTTAKCGTLAMGSVVEVGDVRYGARVGIIDYSKKVTDAYGVTSVVQRAYAKRMEIDVAIPAGRVDYIASALADIRATPVVWYDASSYLSLINYGWLRDWGITITYPTLSESRLTIEGLT